MVIIFQACTQTVLSEFLHFWEREEAGYKFSLIAVHQYFIAQDFIDFYWRAENLKFKHFSIS